jgi:hypothetical protein
LKLRGRKQQQSGQKSNEDTHNYSVLFTQCYYDDQTRMRWARHIAYTRDKNCIGILVGTPEVKRPLWRPRRRWEDNTKMGLKEIGCHDVD